MTNVNTNGYEAYDSGRSKEHQRAATARYRKNTRDAYTYLKSVCGELGITPEELITQSNVQSVARLVRVSMEEENR